MKIYLDCSMGASGDMLMAALYELLPDKDAFREKMQRFGLPGVTFEYSDSIKCGIKGTHISVKVDGVEEFSEDAEQFTIHNSQFTIHDGHGDDHDHDHDHGHTPHSTLHTHHDHDHDHDHTPHSTLHTHHAHDHDHEHEHDHTPHSTLHTHHGHGFDEILDLIRSLDLPESVINDALGVYIILGQAEAAVHGSSLDAIHLHEVGSLDAVADIVGCCLLIHMLDVTEILSSPVHVGSGFVKCAHGILPVPAPATAEILKGIPIYGGQIRGELCTPTGAALLKRFVGEFGNMPPMIPVKIGYGMGQKDFETANCLRALLCNDGSAQGDGSPCVYEICCNLDDMTPEAIGAAIGILFDSGALDVYTTPITMKKSRPAIMLSCICQEDKRDSLARLILQHTSTLGLRIAQYDRMVFDRTTMTVSTEYGHIHVKHAKGFGVEKHKPEYDDVLAASLRHGVPFTTVYNAASSSAAAVLERNSPEA